MEVIRSSLDLANPIPIDISSIESEYSRFYPITPLSDLSSPIVFVVSSSSHHYLQFSDSFLYISGNILNVDGSKLGTTTLAAPSHDFMSSLFSGCEIEQNGVLVSTTATLYPYRAHLVKLLSHDYGYKKSNAQSEMWFEDEKQDVFDATNTGFVTRCAFATGSKTFETMGKISESLFEQHRYTPPNITTKILLRRSDPKLCIDCGDENAKLMFNMLNAVFYVRRHVVAESILAYHHKILSENKKLQFPLNRFVIRGFNIKEGTTQILSEALFRGVIPEYLIISFVSTESIQGKINSQPFNLQHFDISSIQAKIDGESKIYESLLFDFPDKYLIGYNSLSSALGTSGSNHGITRQKYGKGNFLVCIGINPTATAYGNVLDRPGATQVDISFKSALTKQITCLVLGRFNGSIDVDKNFNISAR
jgi:hypothetical protein